MNIPFIFFTKTYLIQTFLKHQKLQIIEEKMDKIKQKIEEGWIHCIFIIEMLGKPKEHLEKTLKGYISALKKDKKVETLKEELLLPKNKPIISDLLKLQAKQKKISLPKKKPEGQTKDQPELLKTQKESDEEKIIAKIDDKKLIFPKKKPIIYQEHKEKHVASKSMYFSKRDFKLAKKIFSEIEKKRWTSAQDLATKASNRSIYKLVRWLYLLEPNNKANFYQYINFIKFYPDFPRLGRLEYLAEHKITSETVKEKRIIQWFEGKEPHSGYGKLMLGQSYLMEGDDEKGISLIKDGWITAKLSKKDLRYFKKKLKKYLNTEDHIKRADWLAWENKYWDLQRMLRYLPKDYQALYKARQLLMSKSYGVDNAIKKVPNKFKNDPGLLYDRLKWRRKRGRVDSSLEILLKIKNDQKFLVRPKKWWLEREIISRHLIYKKKYALAYKVASNHSIKDGPEYAEAEWMSGWIALSFLEDPILATQHFHNFYENVGYPISLSRGAYWLGRSYEKLKDKENSEKWYAEAAKYLTTYYGQLAFMKISPDKEFSLNKKTLISKKNTILVLSLYCF